MSTTDGTLPPALAGALRPTLEDLARHTIAAIGREVPDYARPLEGPFGRALRLGVERALTRFVDEVEAGGATEGGPSDIYVALGRAEQRAGRTLDALLAAYRLGARLAWERFSAAGEAAGFAPATLYDLAGAIFSYIDAISAESVAGFTQEQEHVAGQRQRRRRALALLLARDDVPAAEVDDVAALAGWRRPARVAALVAGGGAGAREPDADRLAARLGPEAVAAVDDGLVVAFLADPDAPGAAGAGRRGRRTAGAAVLGPAVAVEAAARSLRRARAAHALLVAGRLPAEGLTVADEHLPALLLHGADPHAATDLAARVLAPLDALGAGPRARMHATLRAWVDQPGAGPADGGRPARPPADGALPPGAAARPARGRARRRRCALRVRACAAGAGGGARAGVRAERRGRAEGLAAQLAVQAGAQAGDLDDGRTHVGVVRRRDLLVQVGHVGRVVGEGRAERERVLLVQEVEVLAEVCGGLGGHRGSGGDNSPFAMELRIPRRNGCCDWLAPCQPPRAARDAAAARASIPGRSAAST